MQRELEQSWTPDRDNRTTTVVNTFSTWATLKFTLPSATNHIEQFTNILKDFLQELHQANESAAILPWKEKDFHKSRLTSSSQGFPTTITGIKFYLNRLYLPRPGTSMTIYTNLCLGHNNDFHNVRELLQSWLSASSHGLYYKMLQEVGWLLYSTREMDVGTLVDEIEDMIGTNVGLQWKTIPTGAKITTDKNKVQGLCIKVPSKEKWACQWELLKLYSRTIKEPSVYPNGICMCYIKFRKDAINMKEKSKLDKLHERQRQFLQGICPVVNYKVCQLDYSSEEGVIPTLRQMIMNITSKNDGKLTSFHCVDMDWMQEGFTFQFSPDVKEEAETVINTLMPYLHIIKLQTQCNSYLSVDCRVIRSTI